MLERATARRPVGSARDRRAVCGARWRRSRQICEAADELRAQLSGDVVSYVVNRNINYTNVCHYACAFCAFSKGRGHANLRGTPYDLSLDEVARRAPRPGSAAAPKSACRAASIPSYTGQTYLDLLAAGEIRRPADPCPCLLAARGCAWRGDVGLVGSRRFLARLKDAGLGSLPGTAAEILDDAVRERSVSRTS